MNVGQRLVFFMPSFSSGGVEKVLINLANYFSKREYCVTFLVCQKVGELEPLLCKKVKRKYLEKRLSKSFIKAFTFFRENKFDVIICGPQFISILSVILFKILFVNKIKIIVTHHSINDIDTRDMSKLNLFYKYLLRYFYQKADMIVAISDTVKKHLVHDVGINEQKINVIYNPVIDNNFEEYSNRLINHKWLKENRNYKVLISVGRLSKIKNQEALILLFPKILKKLDCKLILIGNGLEEARLKLLSNDLGITEYIDFLGALDNPLPYIKKSDLFILPSISETFSLVAVEAIACGTPVLSTPTTGVKEILTQSSDCCFESIENQNRFIDLIISILKKDKKNINKMFVDKFTVDKIGAKYEELLETL